MNNKRLLITGVSGLLGNNLAYCLKDRYDILGLFYTHAVMIPGIRVRKADLCFARDVKALLREFRPDIIIHCAAVSQVDLCEEQPQLARAVNVGATRNLIEGIKNSGTKFIYISTDLVYAEGGNLSLSEDSPVQPPNEYGLTKLLGEQEALKTDNALVARTNFFGWNIRDKFSLAEWVIHELSGKKEISGFTDVYFSSLYTFDLARLFDAAVHNDIRGIYNFGSRGRLSKYEFALKIAERFGLDKSLIRPISVDQFHLKAKRNKNIAMDVGKIERDLALEIPTIESSIHRLFEDYRKGIPQDIKEKNRTSVHEPEDSGPEVLRAMASLQDSDFQAGGRGAVGLDPGGFIYPQLDYIPYGRQAITEEDIQAVVHVLKSSHITQGPKITEFEEALARYVDARFNVAVNSGTSALHIACLSAGIGPGDEVITSPNTFVASANCVVYCAGRPVFADIDPKTYNIDPKEVAKKITPRTKAIIPVDFAGQSCDMEEISRIVRSAEKKYRHKIYIIEDASHALGSQYRDTKVGSCRFADMAIMSFHPVKHITTGEGGCVLTNDGVLYRRLRSFRSHGITSDPKEFQTRTDIYEQGEDSAQSIVKPWYYEQIHLGYNYRPTDIQCALGLSQLKRLDDFKERRREIVHMYKEAFKDLPYIQLPFEALDGQSNFHLYVLLFDFEKLGFNRSQFMLRLQARRIITQVHYIPVHLQPFYQKNFGTRYGDCPRAEDYYQRCLSIPLFPAMADSDVEYVINVIKNGVLKREKKVSL